MRFELGHASMTFCRSTLYLHRFHKRPFQLLRSTTRNSENMELESTNVKVVKINVTL